MNEVDGMRDGALHYRAAMRCGKTLLGKLRVFQRADGPDNGAKPVMLPGHDTLWRGHGSGNGNGNRTVRHVHRQHGTIFLPARPLTAICAGFEKPAMQMAGFLLSARLHIASVCVHRRNKLPNALAR
ncbi:hypothetical protein [Burkholderia latens]|uniref:hypothetical protein n=1 Tax=Burkholderia latens TaxID=488446 RepID=UPI001478E6D6|nr:hypothetical protein [Burkholderia latens]